MGTDELVTARPGQISASYFSLWLAAVGFLFLGLGNILAVVGSESYPSQLSWVFQAVGPVLIAGAVAFQARRLSSRVGKPAVYFLVIGLLMLGLCCLHLSATNELWLEKWWSNVAQGIWAIGLFSLSFSLIAIASHKQGQVQLVLDSQPTSTGAPKSRVTVEASFLALFSGATGYLLYAVGYVQNLEVHGGTRWSWTLQVSGCALLAVALYLHRKKLARQIGAPALWFAIAGALILALSSIPFVLDPQHYVNSTFWGQSFWTVWGAGALCPSVSALLVIQRKQKLGRQVTAQLLERSI
ncbi:MAG: hypothetical protein QNM01_06555 [Actinomycetes bacterium]